MSLVNFLNGTGPDHQGRYLQDIWNFDDKAIEQTHDFIQWMFPLIEKSMSVPGAPTLSANDIEAISASKTAQANFKKSAQWYLGFLYRNNHWIKPHDHNHLRITRAIKSARLLVDGEFADEMRTTIFLMLEVNIDAVSQKSKQFWLSA